MYNDPIIRPDLVQINKERRMKIRILIVIDEIDESHINRLPTRDRACFNIK
jgi:hypothetical protein